MSTSCYPINAWRVIWHPATELERWLCDELPGSDELPFRDGDDEISLEERVSIATKGRGAFDLYDDTMLVVEFKTEAKARECAERLTQMEEELVALMRAWKERNGNQD